MRLKAPQSAIAFKAKDIFGEPFSLSDMKGKRVVLSFFRDAACPFCNYRIYELTEKYDEWKDAGLEIVTVFSDTDKQVRKHVAKRPRPFRMICDPKLKLYQHYGVEKSVSALFRAIFFNFPEIVKGFAKGARMSNNPNISVVPADFLIDIDGKIVDLWYGRDTADHIPMEKLIKFGSKAAIRSRREKQKKAVKVRQKLQIYLDQQRRKMQMEIDLLRRENNELKQRLRE